MAITNTFQAFQYNQTNGRTGQRKILSGDLKTNLYGERSISAIKIQELAVGSAEIDDASITTAKIVDASITNAKIVSLVADKITAGDILVAVDIGDAGTGFVRLDGANNYILVNDGTNNRIVIGDI